MGWVVILLCVGLLAILTRKTSDRETVRSMKFLAKALAVVVIVIVLIVVLSYTGH